MTYGERLRELRAERRLSLRQVEERGGPNKDTMSLIERDVHRPHPQTLGRIAGALDISVPELRAELESASLPLAQAPPSSTQPPLNGFEEERRRDAYDVALDAARRQAVQSRQATNRAGESGRPQTYFMRHENEAVMELLKYPADELAGALIDTAAAREDERHDSILAKAIGVAAERWAAITTANSGPDRESAPGVYLVAADLENLLSVVMGDGEVWEKLSRVERSEIATVAAALGRVTEGYHDQKDEEQATEQRRAMVRQWTRELATSA